jgi:hypothetical protein
MQASNSARGALYIYTHVHAAAVPCERGGEQDEAAGDRAGRFGSVGVMEMAWRI